MPAIISASFFARCDLLQKKKPRRKRRVKPPRPPITPPTMGPTLDLELSWPLDVSLPPPPGPESICVLTWIVTFGRLGDQVSAWCPMFKVRVTHANAKGANTPPTPGLEKR